jgi:predicted aspartyl protease
MPGVMLLSFGFGVNVKRKFFYVFVACLSAILSGHPAYPQNKPGVAEVPFTFEHSSVIVRAKVNGEGPYNMLLDTGAEQSAGDLNTARDLGLRLAPWAAVKW